MGRRAVVVVADASMLERLLVKDFSNFHNRYVGSFGYACMYIAVRLVY